ncbi:uncharacterized protein Hap1MRO34_014182 [Clarias gariepinus]|uniref:C2H2-type zinc finger protein n=1 Tax=Clarias gariepinus TaxID=13013 RepID=UPI00234C986D|nr:C2H2-type zinc finger protein [Clarias gariepinus]
MEVSGREDTKDPLPLPSLRLLVPPVRLMSAVLWQIMQQQDVLRYGLLADFVSLVTEAVPELFSPTHSAELALRLRAKLILELCYRDETATHLIQPHLSSIQLVKHVDSTEVEETWVHFVELVQTLIKDSEQREHFFQNVFPVEFGPSYDSTLQTLMWDFLSRLEHFLPVPDLLQTVSWLRSESSALKDCEESISNPDSLRSLLHHHKRLGHLDTFAFSSLPQLGDFILTALSGKRNRVAEMDSGASLNPPAPSEMCVMDGTDVETVVVTSEWSEIELRANQTEEDNSDDGDNSLPGANCDQKGESQSNGNMPESEIQTEKLTDTENYLGGSALARNNHDGSVGCTEPMTADSQHLDCDVKGTESLSCSATPSLESELTVPVSVPDGDAVFTRRSARKPKKTWKVLVNLQKQKQKPGVDRRQKRERKPLAPMRTSGIVTDMDGECIASENRDVAVLSQSPGRVTSDGNTELPSKLFSCPQCTFTHLQERYVKSHMKKVHPVPSEPGKEPYVCQVCGKGYRYPGMLKAHERSHTGEQPFQCTASHCGRRFSYSQALRRHRTVHSIRTSPPSDEEAELKKGEPQDDEPYMYSCLYCSESFSSLSARREHHKTHPEDDLKRCNDCGKRLSCQAALIRHKQGHEGERQHKCLLCGSSFVCTTSFKRHMLMHRPERPYHCSCGKGFTYKGALLSHQRAHTTERRYRCSHCNRCFLYPGELRKHERTHSNEKPYLCPHCGKSFKRERILRAHVAGHTEDKIFKCSSCNKTFAYKASLTRHELTHTGERPFLCSDCGKTFFSFGELLKHQRYHTGIKPFQCSHCDKSFTQACYLQLHTRYHTGVRPYTCTQCDKSFFTSCRLKRHMQVHTDEKPYECTECGKRFRQAYVLKVHQRGHTETELRV